ncbi:hypothetical protein [Butyrivibrio hungatei]|uniref:6-pyruvoyl-tetrahydropterin synthase related domain membrane protein n=1 Tax=Butyrivibrio hungatei TaxID=185008 RepID=A0A1D9P478_9FIRM|nr:hypothetical protein [Butyrivibrio hungatei]AOZ97370.1 hypothetical protein bhn_I2337 [Butyrivibrio hungatei]
MKKFWENKKLLILVLVAVEVVLLIVNALRFNREENISYSSDDLLLAHKNLETNTIEYESGFYADHSNVEGAYVVTKPTFLKKGIYSVTVDYSSNAEDNWHTCYMVLDAVGDTSEGKTADLVCSDHTAMPGKFTSVSALSWVKYGTEFEVRMGPETDASGDNIYVLVNSVNITYMKGKTIANETTKLFLFFALIDVLVFLFLLKRKETVSFLKGKELTIGVMLFTLFFSSYPLFYRKLYFGDDIYYHLRRIAFTAEGLRSGQFPVHILPGWDNGYGYAAGVGYGDLLIYPSAILIILGFTLQMAYKFYIFLTNVLSVFISYFAFKKISGNERVGLFSSVLFTLIGFRLHSIYSGATVGEFGAFTFLPLVILGLWEIYSKKSKKAYITLALGVTLTLSCHVLSTFILALVIPLFCILMIEKTLQKEVLLPLLKALLAIVLLNLHFIVPLADYMLFQNMRGNTVNDILWNRGQELVHLFNLQKAAFLDTGGFVGLGVVSIAVLALAAGFVLTGRFKEKTGVYLRLFALSILLIALSLNSTFYFFLSDKMPLMYKLLGNMQFPWHFLDVSCGMVVFWFAVTMGELLRYEDKSIKGYIAMASLVLLCVVQSEELLGDVIKEGNPITSFDSNYLREPFYVEFSIKDINTGLTSMYQDMVLPEGTEATAVVTKKNGTTLYVQADNPTGEVVIAEAPLWGYRHYAAKAKGTKIACYMAEDKKLAVEIPAGYSGLFKIYFREPWFWRLAELVSLVTLVYLLGLHTFVIKLTRKNNIGQL